jgi:CubicO group peptidase (beta-lactamase class C family)
MGNICKRSTIVRTVSHVEAKDNVTALTSSHNISSQVAPQHHVKIVPDIDNILATIANALCTSLPNETKDKEQRTPGAICAYLQSTGNGQQSLQLAAAGVRQSNNTNNKVTKDDIFHLGSCTKAMTATLTAVLIQKGFVPKGYNTTVGEVCNGALTYHQVFEKITIGQLLCHTGMLDKTPPGDSWNTAWNLHEEAIKTPPEQRRIFMSEVMKEPPSSIELGIYQYTNQGYILVGIMLELIMKMDYELLLQKYIFTPLQMTSASFGPVGANRKDAVNCVWGHGEQSNWEPKDPTDLGSDNPTVITPAGRVHATMFDWASFISVHIDPIACEKLLGLNKDCFTSMHEKHMPSTDSYCKGGFIVCDRQWQINDLCLNHDGSNTFNLCSVWLTDGAASLVMTNHGGCYEMVDTAHGEIVSKLLVPKAQDRSQI